MLYLTKHFHQKIRQYAIVIVMTTPYLLIYRKFLLSSQSNFVLLLWAAKTVNKQGYIQASYQEEEMACFKYYEYSFLNRYFSYFQWLEFSPHAWSYRLFEVSGWLKVDLLGDVKVFLPALSQYNLNRFFLAQI